MVYARFSSETGFARPLDQARLYSANAGSYLASAAYAHTWLLALAGKWREVLFPGLVATILGLVGSAAAFRRPSRSPVVVLYVTIGVVALWVSFGPDAGLYRLLHETVPGFTFLRAPVRFGLIVQLALSVLAGLAVADILRRRARPEVWLALILAIAVVESFKPLKFSPVPPVDPVYRTLAKLPAGGVIELPLYSRRFAFLRNEVHAGVDRSLETAGRRIQRLHAGPGDRALRACSEDSRRETRSINFAHDGVRYAVIHQADYSPAEQEKLAKRLREFMTEIRPLDQSPTRPCSKSMTAAPGPDSSTVVR